MHQTHTNLFGQAAALLMHEQTGYFNLRTKMSQQENLFADDSLLWDCDGCAPPTFNIPPPPRPPWMEEVEDCQAHNEEESLSDWLSQMQTCDSTLIRDSQSYFEDTFHSIAIIVVSSIVLVICILSIGLYIFKRRKNFRDSCHQRNSQLDSRPRFIGNVNPAIDCATPTHLSHTLGPYKANQVIYEGQAVTSLTNSGQTMTRCLANHYIPDHQKMMTLDTVLRKQAIVEDFRQRFAPPENRRNVMELAERPPMVQPSDVYQNDYPHIVIGGKPFFLVPSSSNVSNSVDNSEAYAYPQHMPIYEEIDYNTVSAPLGSGSAASMMMMDRPLSSAASHSNSAHTNTSELSSSGDTSSSSSQKMEMTDNNFTTPKRGRPSPYSPRRTPQNSKHSVYYYSDTLNKKAEAKVNTKVTLEKDSKKGSTLV